MSPDPILDGLERVPFQSFRMTLTEGSTYDIHHPSACIVTDRVVDAAELSSKGRRLQMRKVAVLALEHIVKIEAVEAAVPNASAAA